jgi:hypothetical protein
VFAPRGPFQPGRAPHWLLKYSRIKSFCGPSAPEVSLVFESGLTPLTMRVGHGPFSHARRLRERMSIIRRPDPSLRGALAWTIPAAVGCALVAGFVASHLPGYLASDTVVLVNGARRIAFCLSHGIYSRCEPAPVHYALVGPFPLFQYGPAFVMTQLLGMGDASVYRAFTIISTLSFCTLVGLSGWTVSHTGRRWAPAITVLILTTSPLVFYAWSTLGESLAALLIALMAVAALRRWPPIVLALTAFLACITKETVFPIVAILGAVSLWATPIGSRPLRREHWIGLACGVLLALGVSAAFNWFRYHQLTNAAYLAAKLQVPGVGRRLALGVDLWLAPNGGTALFWPLAAALVIGLIAIASTASTRRPMRRMRTVPALGLIVSLLVYLLGRSRAGGRRLEDLRGVHVSCCR